ncbi:50S ribosomal protein L11 methyltransferase [Ochrobactrum sp. CM-21-5]|nr:50S ribosomal protein L11 methyltransferase [Ochrobactrum sp. CM-21-5]MBC2885921.1 50S ribosomal protein L11 methyltransferase [Ochrobactrum sp. CM-21-5]
MVQSRLFFSANKAEAERVYDILERELEDDGFPIAITEIDEDRQIFEVSVYIEDGVAALSSRIDALVGTGKFETEELPDIDWVTHSLEGLKPVRAGHFFVHGSHDRDKIEPNDIPIEIDAGLAFGTGHHGTTAGCLEMIEEIVEDEHPTNALDLGTGSAVLAIAIAKLAPIPVLATDNDPIAVTVAAENAANNGVAEHIVTATAEGFSHPIFRSYTPFDLIVANILANPLIELAPSLKEHLASGGSIILSGILDSQHDAVLAAYQAQGLTHQKTLHREGWVAIHLK